ncbi:DNA methylase [Escherichia coli]|nr:DNA methylase [Escherichia coli]
MALAGSEMKRLYAVGVRTRGDGDAFVREEREANGRCVTARGRGAHVMKYQRQKPAKFWRNYRAVINGAAS